MTSDRTDRDHGLRPCALTSLLDAEIDAEEDTGLHVAGDGALDVRPLDAREREIERRVDRVLDVTKGARPTEEQRAKTRARVTSLYDAEQAKAADGRAFRRRARGRR